MTLILASINQNSVCIASDMRMTANGRVLSDEKVKLGFLVTSDSRIIYGITGLTECGAYKTSDAIIREISRNSGSEADTINTLRNIRNKLTIDFNSLSALKKASKRDRRLSIIFCGYKYEDSGIEDSIIHPFAAVISNFEIAEGDEYHEEAQDEFTLTWIQAFEWCNCFGSIQAICTKEYNIFKKLVSEGRPEHTLKQKAEIIILAAANSPYSKNSVGENILFGTLSIDPRIPAKCLYRPKSGKNKYYGMSMTNAVNGLSLKSVTFTDSITPIPERQRPKSLCACDSGKKYKNCCGKIRPNSRRKATQLEKLFRKVTVGDDENEAE